MNTNPSTYKEIGVWDNYFGFLIMITALVVIAGIDIKLISYLSQNKYKI
jgi:hypothetical protein